MLMNQIITDSFDQITALCKQHSVMSLYVFGSVLTPGFNPASDIDSLFTSTLPKYLIM